MAGPPGADGARNHAEGRGQGGERPRQLEVGLRLRAAAFDGAGQSIDRVAVLWVQSGGAFEGTVDSTGLVTAGVMAALAVLAALNLAYLLAERAHGGATPRNNGAEGVQIDTLVARIDHALGGDGQLL